MILSHQFLLLNLLSNHLPELIESDGLKQFVLEDLGPRDPLGLIHPQALSYEVPTGGRTGSVGGELQGLPMDSVHEVGYAGGLPRCACE